MIAGTLARLNGVADEPLESHSRGPHTALDVDTSVEYLDDYRVQTGRIAGRVKQQAESVTVDGTDIEITTPKERATVATPFVADVDRDGWILAERTHTTEDEHKSPWPFSQFEIITGREVEPLGIDVETFVERQREADRSISLEMTTTEREHSEDVRIDWGRQSETASANVGAALTVNWDGEFVRLVVYQSGYTAIWEPTLADDVVGRFVHEELMPVTAPLTEDGELATTQTEVTV